MEFGLWKMSNICYLLSILWNNWFQVGKIWSFTVGIWQMDKICVNFILLTIFMNHIFPPRFPCKRTNNLLKYYFEIFLMMWHHGCVITTMYILGNLLSNHPNDKKSISLYLYYLGGTFQLFACFIKILKGPETTVKVTKNQERIIFQQLLVENDILKNDVKQMTKKLKQESELYCKKITLNEETYSKKLKNDMKKMTIKLQQESEVYWEKIKLNEETYSKQLQTIEEKNDIFQKIFMSKNVKPLKTLNANEMIELENEKLKFACEMRDENIQLKTQIKNQTQELKSLKNNIDEKCDTNAHQKKELERLRKNNDKTHCENGLSKIKYFKLITKIENQKKELENLRKNIHQKRDQNHQLTLEQKSNHQRISNSMKSKDNVISTLKNKLKNINHRLKIRNKENNVLINEIVEKENEFCEYSWNLKMETNTLTAQIKNLFNQKIHEKNKEISNAKKEFEISFQKKNEEVSILKEKFECSIEEFEKKQHLIDEVLNQNGNILNTLYKVKSDHKQNFSKKIVNSPPVNITPDSSSIDHFSEQTLEFDTQKNPRIEKIQVRNKSIKVKETENKQETNRNLRKKLSINRKNIDEIEAILGAYSSEENHGTHEPNVPKSLKEKIENANDTVAKTFEKNTNEFNKFLHKIRSKPFLKFSPSAYVTARRRPYY